MCHSHQGRALSFVGRNIQGILPRNLTWKKIRFRRKLSKCYGSVFVFVSHCFPSNIWPQTFCPKSGKKIIYFGIWNQKNLRYILLSKLLHQSHPFLIHGPKAVPPLDLASLSTDLAGKHPFQCRGKAHLSQRAAGFVDVCCVPRQKLGVPPNLVFILNTYSDIVYIQSGGVYMYYIYIYRYIYI